MNSRNKKVKASIAMKRNKTNASQKLCKTISTRKIAKTVMPINPMLPRNYTMEDRIKLKAFEKSILLSSERE